MLASKFDFFRRSPGKSYRQLPLDSRYAIKRSEPPGVTHGGTKTGLGSGIKLTTSHKS
ncbi:hypothetical protein Hanom_Chr17g01540851 [Helianthus anomalus]